MQRTEPSPAPSLPEPEAEERRRAPWRPERARVLEQRPLEGGWRELVLHAPYTAAHARPGHFVQIAVRSPLWQGWDPFLRRPFSLCRIEARHQTVAVIFRPGGRGTAALAALAPGQELDLLGPLGRSFPEPDRPSAATGAPLLLVGQGHGVLALMAAARWAVVRGRPVELLAFARSASELPAREELLALDAPVSVVTADGSAGQRGEVGELLQQRLQAGAAGEVWASGPEPLLVAVKRACGAAGVPAYLNVERPMACGFGVCMGCSLPKAAGFGYWHVCVDGPVFRAEEVRLNGEGGEDRAAAGAPGLG